VSRNPAARLLLASMLFGLGWGAARVARAAAPPVPPSPTEWVTDGAGFLSEAVRRHLDARLDAYSRASGHQVIVWIAPDSGGLPIEEFAVRAFAAWKVGRKGLDDGVAVFIFAEQRKIRIEVGYGLEGTLPDALASRIIREVMIPRIQAGDREGAVEAGLGAIVTTIGGPSPRAEEERPAAPAPGARPLGPGQLILLGLAGLAFLVLFITNPSLALFLLLNILSGGRGGGGGGGGGFSGGGGRSGGGGASGSW
jgi:uncharacterized protein